MKARLRTLPTREPVAKVDLDAGVIKGTSVAQAVTALGHDMSLDDVFLRQLMESGNKDRRGGVKSRFTHPGMSNSGLGKFLGRVTNFSIDEERTPHTLVGDIVLSPRSRTTPNGDLGLYVMEMARDEPEMFGLSIVFDYEKVVWVLEDGREVDGSMRRPDDAVYPYQSPRLKDFVACDVVDEPAANRGGMFSSDLWDGSAMGEEAFAEIDEMVTEMGLSPERIRQFVFQYCDARGIDVSPPAKPLEESMEGNKTGAKAPDTESTPVVNTPVDDAPVVTAGKPDGNDEIKVLTEQLNVALSQIKALKQKERHAELSALNDGWPGPADDHMAILNALDVAKPELVTVYAGIMDAATAQIEAGSLFEEMGDAGSDDGSGMSPVERIVSEFSGDSDALRLALSKLFNEDPDAYAEYATSATVKVK